MIAILETDDPVRPHYLRMVLEAADLHPFLLQCDSAYLSLMVRLMVPESEADLARHLIAEAERALAAGEEPG